MKQFFLTIRNCLILGSFRYFKLLYHNVDIPIVRTIFYGRAMFEYQHLPNYVPLNIQIGLFWTRREVNTALLHEIGHLIDINKRHHYPKYISLFQTEKLQQIKEKAAWKWCIRLSNSYNINICYQTAANWLGTYGAKYQVLENRK